MFDDGTTPTNGSTVRFLWQQNIVCSGGVNQKVQDTLPMTPCSFYSAEDGALRTNATW
jgi:hypothetical protein